MVRVMHQGIIWIVQLPFAGAQLSQSVVGWYCFHCDDHLLWKHMLAHRNLPFSSAFFQQVKNERTSPLTIQVETKSSTDAGKTVFDLLSSNNPETGRKVFVATSSSLVSSLIKKSNNEAHLVSENGDRFAMVSKEDSQDDAKSEYPNPDEIEAIEVLQEMVSAPHSYSEAVIKMYSTRQWVQNVVKPWKDLRDAERAGGTIVQRNLREFEFWNVILRPDVTKLLT